MSANDLWPWLESKIERSWQLIHSPTKSGNCVVFYAMTRNQRNRQTEFLLRGHRQGPWQRQYLHRMPYGSILSKYLLVFWAPYPRPLQMLSVLVLTPLVVHSRWNELHLITVQSSGKDVPPSVTQFFAETPGIEISFHSLLSRWKLFKLLPLCPFWGARLPAQRRW